MSEVKNKRIIIGFSRAKSMWKIGSTIIREVEKRDYSHVYIRYLDETTDVDLICQASHGMVNQMSTEIFLQQNIIVKEYGLLLTETEYTDVLRFLHNNLGKNYSYLQLVFIAIKKLLRFEINIHDKDNSFICSELGARVCIIANKIKPTNTDYTSPSDLEKLLESIVYGETQQS